MNTIREGRNILANAQHSNLRIWKKSIETFRDALDETEKNQQTQRGLKTPRGIETKWKELIEKFINELNGFTIKKEQVRSVTQFFVYKSHPKNSSQERNFSPERIKNVLTKIYQREFKTPAQKLDNDRRKLIKKFGDVLDPYNAPTVCNVLVNMASGDLKAFAYKLLAFFTADPNDISAKGVELHNYCLEEKNLISFLEAWNAQNAARRDSEEYRLLRCWAKCLFNLKGVMNRYPDNQPPQKLTASIKEMSQPMDPISHELCLAFFKAGKGKEARELMESQELKLAVPARRTFLQDAKAKFEQIQRGDSLRYDVAHHAFIPGDNPLVVLKDDEKSHLLLQLIHACCVNEMAKLSDLFPHQGVALDCYFEGIIDQKGWAAFEELDKCLAAINPSSQAVAASAHEGGQEVGQEKEVKRKRPLQRRLSFSAQPPEAAAEGLTPAATKSVPKLVMPKADPQAAPAAVAAPAQVAAIAQSTDASGPAFQAAIAPVIAPAPVVANIAPRTDASDLGQQAAIAAMGNPAPVAASNVPDLGQQAALAAEDSPAQVAAKLAQRNRALMQSPQMAHEVSQLRSLANQHQRADLRFQVAREGGVPPPPQVAMLAKATHVQTPAGHSAPLGQKQLFEKTNKKPGNRFLAWLKNCCDWFNVRIYNLMKRLFKKL